jgi:spore germination protein
VQQLLIQNILAKMREKGYTGLDVDFEFLGKENALPYAAFLERVTVALNAEGYTVTAALAPKVRADQPGLLYEGHDYAAVAAAVNRVLLMTYEWGYTYSAPMAVSPLSQVRRVIEYALTEMPAEKILLGISNYGYKWTLPYNAAAPVAAPSVSTAEAVELAVQNGAQILYDEAAQAPHFSYRAGGVDYEVWFEDARSLRARLLLVPEYGLNGALYWNLDRRNTQNLSMLASLKRYGA